MSKSKDEILLLQKEYYNAIDVYSFAKLNAYKSVSAGKKEMCILQNNELLPVGETEKEELNHGFLSYLDVVAHLFQEGITTSLLRILQVNNLTKFEVHIVMTILSLSCNLSFRNEFYNTFNSKIATYKNMFQLYYTFDTTTVDASFWEKNKRLSLLFFKDVEVVSWNTHLQFNQVAFQVLRDCKPTLPFFCHTMEHSDFPLNKSAMSLTLSQNEFLQTITDHTLGEIMKTHTLVLTGSEGIGKKRAVQALGELMGKEIVFVDAISFTTQKNHLKNHYNEVILRIAVLCHVEICFYDFPTENNGEQITFHNFTDFLALLAPFNKQFFMTSEHTNSNELWKVLPHLSLSLEPLSPYAQKQIWQEFLRNSVFSGDISGDGLTSKFSLTMKQIEGAVSESILKFQGTPISEEELTSYCYHQTTSLLHENAMRIEKKFMWEDLILPKELKEAIQKSCNHIKYKSAVLGDWGFSSSFAYGTGTNILFAGPPGTGKTMITQIIAKSLNMELYRIDLSAVVSKYIGETEKNLDKIFDSAKNSGVILFFDEMDSLFGKRSEAQDAHDKYANMETAYLLQKIEFYDGVLLMATNYLSNIDEAFMRRLHFVFTLPLPTAVERVAIWRNCLPKTAPVSPEIDFEFLGEKFSISPAIIKNITLSSAFFACGEQREINMLHIVKAIYYEMKKENIVLVERDFMPYEYLLKEVILDESSA